MRNSCSRIVNATLLLALLFVVNNAVLYGQRTSNKQSIIGCGGGHLIQFRVKVTACFSYQLGLRITQIA
jgi:hypothetical protein